KETVSYEITMQTMAGEYQADQELVLTKEASKEYRIQWDSGVIFPGLKESDKVRIQTTPAVRGNIYDRNQTLLAGEGLVTQVSIVPGKLGENKAEVVAQIAGILGMTPEEITKKLEASWVKSDSAVPIKEIPVGDEQTEAALVGANGEGAIPGVMTSDVPERVYPLGEKAGHLTGYIQTITEEQLKEKAAEGYHSGSTIGKAGLEKRYEKELRPTDGAEIYIEDSEGNKKETVCLKAPQNGKDVTVTIDAATQQTTYDQFSTDAATAVVMNPKTGELLALVSAPGYNPNEFILGMSDARWQELNQDGNQPLTNRYSTAWVPGSTFKPITAATGVDAGKISPEDNKGNVGLRWQKDGSWGNYFVTTLTDYGSEVNLANALIYSDNIYFARAALDIGTDTFATALSKLGFGEEMPVDLALQTSTYGKDNQIENEIQLADTGYGQGQVLVNPVHLASIYSAFVNQGSMILPVLRSGEQATGPTFWKENVFTPQTADLIQNDLIQVIENPQGTGASAKIQGVTLLGKTGTAETKGSQGEAGAKELGWFACETTSEMEKPISVIAMVEDVQAKGVKHYVNDKVKIIMESYLQQ
ncbi:MAG: penicillin-binding transpeptidase domain-containing protein, partial [Lachnospiraceae bacterium]